MATWTGLSQSSAPSWSDVNKATDQSEQHLLSGDGFKLTIGGGFFLIIQPFTQAVNWADQAANTATWSPTNKT